MRKAEKRVDDLFKALSAKERARLALRAFKEGKRGDDRLIPTMPPDQAGEYAGLMACIDKVNFILGPMIGMLGLEIRGLFSQLGWLATLNLLVAAKARDRDQDTTGVVGQATMAIEMEKMIAAAVGDLWTDLQAMKRVLQQVGLVFDNEDPCYPPLRTELDKVEASLHELHRHFEMARIPAKPVHLPRPGSKLVERKARELVNLLELPELVA